jgi:fructosamine-3-kinase
VSLPAGARDARRVSGGDINEAFRVVLHDGREAFVKTRADAPPGEYAAEAAGLQWLAEPGALRTPRVLDVSDGYLALEWIAPGRISGEGEQELGRGLAATHLAGAPRFGSFRGAGAPRFGSFRGAGGPSIDRSGGHGEVSGEHGDVAWLGSLRLSNKPTADWPSFYAERRLRPLARLAREREALGASGLAALERVCERIAELTGPAEPPARLHGDLWHGNVLADTHGRPWLVDPFAYGGHREMDLAMLALFGSPSERVLGSYLELAPLADGWEERTGLYQLFPLLVHALLFGGSYRDAAARMALRYAG